MHLSLRYPKINASQKMDRMLAAVLVSLLSLRKLISLSLLSALACHSVTLRLFILRKAMLGDK